MAQDSIGFIGGGNMACSIIGGLIADGRPAQSIRVSDPNESQISNINQRWPGVQTTTRNTDVAGQADVVVLAVKPQVLQAVARELSAALQAKRPLVISIAAGVRERDLGRWLGGNLAIVRCMPNTPALVRSGATGLYANSAVSPAQRDSAESILRAVGLTLWFEQEEALDAVTAVSGSGPAYFFFVMEAIEQAGVELGLSREAARLLSLETAFGAAKLALESRDDAATLRKRVTSKGGTTERAIAELEQGGLRALFQKALAAAAQRSRELAEELGADEK